MESWRNLAIELFPEFQGLYEDPEETVYFVLFDMRDEIVQAHQKNDVGRLEKIYKFAEWCHSQKEIDPGIWEAAQVAFYEHLVDHEATYKAIPQWVSPEVFQDMLLLFENYLENKAKYPFDRPGTFTELVKTYNTSRGTNFTP